MDYGIPIQKQIFLRGLAKKKPVVPLRYDKLKSRAKSILPTEAYAYISAAAGQGNTKKANSAAFDDYKLHAQMMRSTSEVDMGVEVVNNSYDVPILAAPIGALELAHPDADIAVAEACSELNIPMVFSNQASHSIEDCAAAMGNAPRWFQLYWSKSDELVESFLQRAEECKCEAIVVTLDTTSLGWRPKDLELAYLPFLHAKGLAQYSSDPVFNEIVEKNMRSTTTKSGVKPPINYHTIKNVLQVCRNYPGSFITNLFSGKAMTAIRTFINIYMRPTLEWNDLKRLRHMTDLPILAKGVHTVEDARKAFEVDVDGIIVSNHGGRQIDGGEGALHCLDKICAGLESDGGDILFDSGIRSGADVIKAIALGADAVLIGRPYVYGLGIAGMEGVREVFRAFLAEMELQLSLMGFNSLKDVDRNIFRID